MSDEDDPHAYWDDDDNPFQKKRRGYEVGYGKPPSQHQFQKGNKAAAGKRKRSRDRGMAQAILKIADEKIAVIINGKRQSMSRREALARHLFEKAMKSPRDGLRMLQLLLGIDETMPFNPEEHRITVEFVHYRPKGLPGAPPEPDGEG